MIEITLLRWRKQKKYNAWKDKVWAFSKPFFLPELQPLSILPRKKASDSESKPLNGIPASFKLIGTDLIDFPAGKKSLTSGINQ